MPRRTAPETAEDRAIREVSDEDENAMRTLALEAGPPPDSSRLSEADEDAAWEQMDPNVDHEQLATMLMTQGLPPELAQQLLIVKLRRDEDWMGALTKPTQDAELANQLAKLARYPFRLSVIDGYDDPDEQVRKANAVDRRYQKRMAQVLDAPISLDRSGYGQMMTGGTVGLEGQGAAGPSYPQGPATTAPMGVPGDAASLGAAGQGRPPAAQMMLGG